MAERVVIAELDINAEAFIKKTADIKKQIDQLKADQKELTKVGGTSSKAYIQNAADLKVLSQAYNANIKALSENTKATADAIAREELLTSVLLEEVSSIQEARNQNKLLNKLRNETNVTTEQGRKELKALNDALDSNNEFIKENADSYLKQKINIGNYASALSGLSPELQKVVNGLKGTLSFLKEQKENLTNVVNTTNNYITTIIKKTSVTETNTAITQVNNTAIQNNVTVTQAQTTAQKASTLALNAGSKALKIFRLALISTGIGAIVVALGSLVAYLASTQKGMDLVSKVTAAVGAAFSVLFDRVTQVGGALVKFFSGDFSGAFDDLKDASSGFGDELAREVALAVKLEAELQKLKRVQVAINVGRSEANKIIKEQNKIAEDVTKTNEERLTAINKAIDAETKQINLENQLANDQLKNALQLDGSFDSNKEKIQEIRQAFIDSQEDVSVFQEKLFSIGISETTLEDIEKIGDAIIANNNKITASEEALTTLGNKKNIINQGIAAAEQKVKDDAIQANKDAIKQAKEIADKAISEQEAQLDKFIESQGIRKKSLDDQLKFEQDVFNKQKEILDAELKNRNITQTEYDAQLLALQNELAQSRVDLLQDEYQKELDLFIANNQSKIDSEQFFSDESLRIEQERINAISEKQKEFFTKQLEDGVINRQEFNAAINQVDEENRLANEEAQKQRDEAQKEADLINLENQRILDQQNFETKLEADLANLEIQRQKEIENAEKTGADIDLINKKFAKSKEQIELAAADAKVAAEAAAFGEIAGLLGEESTLGKLAALTQAGINVQQGITKAIAQGGFAGIATGAVVAAKGAISIAKIAGVNTKFEHGGIASIDGARHSQGGVPIFAGDKYIGEAEGGEGIGILNRGAYASFMDFNNRFGSGSSSQGFYEGGGIITQTIPDSESSNAELLNAIQNMKAPIVTVEDIRRGSKSFVEVETVANV